jgi:histidine ammonia-lyase
MTTPEIILGQRPIAIGDVALASGGPIRVRLTEAARARMKASRKVVDDHMTSDVPVYGLNTGLGGNVGHRIKPDEIPAFQEQMVRGRIAAVGDPLPLETCRAALFCRTAALAQGGAGVSPHVHELMLAMLERDVTPVLPSRGSVGAGDLIVLMSIAHVLIGRGKAWHDGRIMSGADALAAAELQPVKLGAKDGLAIANASGMTCALAALSLHRARELLAVHVATAAYACDGYAANPRIFDTRLAAARPAASQEAAAALFRRGMEGSTQHAPGAARLVQDALCFRTLSQVTGSTLAAFDAAREAVETELNAAADNPLVLPETGEIHSSANFHTPAIALAFDTLAIAMTHVATASANRSIKLMTGRLSGLPNYLSPIGGASAGFVPMQKAISALQAEVRLKAQPASLDGLAVSDTVEDLTPQTALTIRKFDEQIEPARWLISIEALLAAQACDLRAAGGIQALGRAGRMLHQIVRSVADELVEDRETGLDAAAVHTALWREDTIGAVDTIFAGLQSPISAGRVEMHQTAALPTRLTANGN